MVEKKDGGPNHQFIPRDYEELYVHYIQRDDSLCRMLLRHFLPYSSQEERDNLAHDVFVRMMDKKILEIFDPTKANFGGAIFFTTRSVAVNFLSRRGRDPMGGLKGGTIISEPAEDFEPGQYPIDSLFSRGEPNYANQIDAKDLVNKLVAWAYEKFTHAQHKRDRSLLPLLGMLLQQQDPQDCAKALGVTTSTTYNWISILRDRALELKAELL